MDKLISFFTKNTIWKITALFMAIILWIIAINIEDPMLSKPFYAIPLELRNIEVLEQYGLVLLNREELEKKSVMVRVLANNKLLNTQLSSSNIKAYIDLSPVSFSFMDRLGETLTPPVEIEFPSFADTIHSYDPTPTTVGIVLDKLATKDFSVTVVKTAEPADGYVSMEPVPSPASIKLTGAASILDTVHSVRLDVDLTGAKADYATTGKLTVYSVENVDITNKITLETTEAQVFVPVNMHNQVPVIMPVINGFPADGYTITSVEADVKSIDVVGKAEELSNLTGIRLDPIDITGASETLEVKRDVRDFLRSTNLSVRNGKPHEVIITIVLEKETVKEFNIPISNLEILGEHSDISFESNVNVRLKGLSKIISTISGDSIKGVVDLTGLSPGEHLVSVSLNLPEGVSIVGDEPMARIIIASNTEPESAEPPANESETNQTEGTEPEQPELPFDPHD